MLPEFPHDAKRIGKPREPVFSPGAGKRAVMILALILFAIAVKSALHSMIAPPVNALLNLVR